VALTPMVGELIGAGKAQERVFLVPNLTPTTTSWLWGDYVDARFHIKQAVCCETDLDLSRRISAPASSK
jgi:hypothetical protein